VVKLLCELREKALEYAGLDRRAGQNGRAREAFFDAEQNALVAKNAERYYRTMVRGGAASWNVRDHHMFETLERLMELHGPEARAIVWEHNTHIGDARATDMAASGMVNIGQLARERHDGEAALVGFGSHRGSVIAGSSWGAPMQAMRVPEAEAGSWEDVFHRAGAENQLLLFPPGNSGATLPEAFYETRGHRAIGVVYEPAHERFGNYVPTVLPRRYDAFLFIDETRALDPLHLRVRPEHEVPETFPSGV